ncbi:MAG: hypothetical protein O2782_08130 [bacterium]|nr:hypothetical protein [bacterium]
MRRRRWLLAAALLLLVACGKEPDRIVSAETEDGRWELTLEARRNVLRSGENLAVRVTLRSLAGQPAATFRDTIDFLCNAGTVSPNRLVFTFIGTQDTTYAGTGSTTTYSDWITYSLSTSSSQANENRQGEISALYRDLEAVLKIRIVVP